MTSFRFLFLASALSVGVIFSTAASADSWSITDLGFGAAYGINNSGQVVGANAGGAFITGVNGAGVTSLGGGSIVAYGINSSGQVVGDLATTSGRRAFVTGAGGVGMTNLGTLPGYDYWSSAVGINDVGQVVGTSLGNYGPNSGPRPYHAFIAGPNSFGVRDLGSLGGPNSFAMGINASGQVVGAADEASGNTYNFITGANGVGMTAVSGFGDGFGAIFAINNLGQVAGQAPAADGSFYAAVTGANGAGMTYLGGFGGPTSTAYAINNLGQVAGTADLFRATGWPPPSHAFVTGENGVGITDLNSLVTLAGGAYLSEARGINDLGQIIANATNGHAYLLSPVPEPETYALMLAGIGVIGFVVRRRRRCCTRLAG